MTLKIEVELSPVFQTAFQSSSVLIELDEDEGTVKGLLRRLSSESEGKISSLLFEEGMPSLRTPARHTAVMKLRGSLATVSSSTAGSMRIMSR